MGILYSRTRRKEIKGSSPPPPHGKNNVDFRVTKCNFQGNIHLVIGKIKGQMPFRPLSFPLHLWYLVICLGNPHNNMLYSNTLEVVCIKED